MIQLVYLSFASTEFKEKVEKGINDILDIARDFNSSKNITGMLLYRSGVFLQLLEGDEQEVKALYGKIALDSRHEGIKVVVNQQNNERVFEHWSMAYRKIDDKDFNKLESIVKWDDLIQESSEGKSIPNTKIMQLFKEFRFKLV